MLAARRMLPALGRARSAHAARLRPAITSGIEADSRIRKSNLSTEKMTLPAGVPHAFLACFARTGLAKNIRREFTYALGIFLFHQRRRTYQGCCSPGCQPAQAALLPSSCCSQHSYLALIARHARTQTAGYTAHLLHARYGSQDSLLRPLSLAYAHFGYKSLTIFPFRLLC